MTAGWLSAALLIAAMMFLAASSVFAADWSSCHDDLDRLRRAASSASDAAEEAGSKYREAESTAQEVESAASSLRLCQSWSRDCYSERSRYQSARSDYDSAKSYYESAKSTAESELDTVSSRVRSAESSCGTSLGGVTVVGHPGSDDPLCRLLLRFKGRLAAPKLMELCRRSKSEAECKQCLE